jgi:hypothetical protein
MERMINRQRKRALNLIRCHKNVEILHLVRSAKMKIDNLRNELLTTPSPKFISYLDGEVYVIDGFTKHQAAIIELEALITAIERAELNFRDYYHRLGALLNQINAISSQ